MRKEELIMKKKLLIIFILLGMLALFSHPISLQAATEDFQIKIFVEGTNGEADLEIPGYQIISRNVDFNVSGKYVVTYENQATHETIVKPIYVVKPQQLLDQGLTIQVSNQKLNLDNKITSHLKLDDGSIVFVTREPNEVEQEDYVNLFITRILNNEVIWNVSLMTNIYGSVVQLMQDGDYLVGLGYRYFKYSSLDNFIFKMPLEGGTIKYGYFGGTNVDTPKALVKSENKYLIFGDTKSEKGELGGHRESEDTYMMPVDAETLKYQKATYYSMPLNDTCNGAVMLNGNCYFLQSFHDEVGLPSNRIVKIDSNGNIMQSRVINVGYYTKAIKLVVKNDTLYILGADNHQGVTGSVIYQAKEDLQFRKIDINPYNSEYTNMYIVDMVVDENNDINILYNIRKNRQQGILLRKLFQKDHYQTAHVIDHIDNEMYNDALITLNNDGKLHIINNRNYEEVSMYHVKVNNFGNNNVNNMHTPKDNYQIFFDGLSVYHNKDLTNINIDYRKFGKYLNKYYFNDSKILLVYNREFNVLPNVSIQDHQKYDTFVKLTFNGDGLLNNQAITSGFQVERPGEYELVVIGKEFAKVKYQFTVEEYSQRPTFLEDEPNLTIMLSDVDIKEPKESPSITCQTEENTNIKNSPNLTLLYLLMPITIGSGLGFVLIKRW